jgi:hypothetical protein
MDRTHKPRIFLCHANEDQPRVMELYRQLKEAGYEPWLDKYDLLPGQNWRSEIRGIITDPYNLVVVCLSCNSLTKRGVVQQEIAWALDVLERTPEGAIYLIPARLEDCKVPDRLADLHWVNLFELKGFEYLKRSLDYEIGKRADGVPFIPQKQRARSEEQEEAQGLEQERLAGEQAAQEEAEREAERLPAEQAEIAPAKPKVKAVGPEPAESIVHKKPAEKAWNWERLRLPVVALVGLVIVGVVIGLFGGGGKPTPTPIATPSVVAVAQTASIPSPVPPPPTPTPDCRDIQVPFLELYFSDGQPHERSLEGTNVVTVTLAEIDNLPILSGRAVLSDTNAEACTCTWLSRMGNTGPWRSMDPDLKNCDFSIEVPRRDMDVQLKLTIGNNAPQGFIIRVSDP